MPVKSKAVVVTGVSTGIGHGIAAFLINRGFHVFGSVRTQADAGRLLKCFEADSFTPLLFDVRDQLAVLEAAALVRKQLGSQKLFGLVNNAGVADTGPAELIPIDIARKVMDINFLCALIVCQAFIPLLGSDKSLQGPPGRIVQISSVSSTLVIPSHGVYSASKAALDALTDSMRRELVDTFGIQVSLVLPGMVPSEIRGKIQMQQFENSAYVKAVQFLKQALDAAKDPTKCTPVENVAGMVHSALTSRSPRLCYYPTSWSEYVLLSLFACVPRWLGDVFMRFMVNNPNML